MEKSIEYYIEGASGGWRDVFLEAIAHEEWRGAGGGEKGFNQTRSDQAWIINQ